MQTRRENKQRVKTLILIKNGLVRVHSPISRSVRLVSNMWRLLKVRIRIRPVARVRDYYVLGFSGSGLLLWLYISCWSPTVSEDQCIMTLSHCVAPFTWESTFLWTDCIDSDHLCAGWVRSAGGRFPLSQSGYDHTPCCKSKYVNMFY